MKSASTAYKQITAKRVTKLFFGFSVAAFIVVLIAVVSGLVVPLFFKEDDKVLAAKLIYSATGILIGALEVVLGILVSLIGLTADYDIDASVGSAKVKLASASPGLLLILCGNLLMGFSLMREFTYTKIESQEPQEESMQTISPRGNQSDVKPLPTGGPE